MHSLVAKLQTGCDYVRGERNSSAHCTLQSQGETKGTEYVSLGGDWRAHTGGSK